MDTGLSPDFEPFLVSQVFQRDPFQELADFLVEAFPKIECDALTFSVADGSVFIAAGFLERVVHGFQNIDHRDLIRRFGKRYPPAGPRTPSRRPALRSFPKICSR